MGDGRAGTVFEYGDGYRAMQFAVRPSDGMRKRITGTGATKRQAWERLEANRDRFMRGERKGGRKTLVDLVAEWDKVQEGNGTESKARVLGNMRNHVIPRLRRGIVLVDIDAKMLRRWLSDLRDDTTPYVARNAYNSLSTILTYAVRQDYIEANPLRRVQKPSKPRGKKNSSQKAMTRQARTYVGLVQSLRHDGDPAYYWVLTLGLGLRRAEVCGLKWDAVVLDGDQPLIEVSRVHAPRPHRIQDGTKNKTTRYIPLGPTYVQAMRDWKRQWRDADEEWAKGQVFTKVTKKDGVKGFKSKRLYEDWRKLLRTFVDPHGTMTDDEFMASWYFTPHDVRRISASIMRQQGVPEQTIRGILGHHSSAMTDLYASPIYDGQVVGTHALEGVLTGPVGAVTGLHEPWMDDLAEGTYTPGYDDGIKATADDVQVDTAVPGPSERIFHDPWAKSPPGPTKNAPESP